MPGKRGGVSEWAEVIREGLGQPVVVGYWEWKCKRVTKIDVSVTTSLAWTNYLKAKSCGRMEWLYGPLPLEEKMPEREAPLMRDAWTLQYVSEKFQLLPLFLRFAREEFSMYKHTYTLIHER